MSQPPLDKVLQDYIDFLSLELPERTFTREWIARENMKNTDLDPGHFTLIYKGHREYQDIDFVMIDLLLVGRIYCGVHASGLDIQQAELRMEQDIREFCSGTNGAHLRIKSSVTSNQMETEYGWVVLDCESGPHCVRVSSMWDDPTLADIPEITELTTNGEELDVSA